MKKGILILLIIGLVGSAVWLIRDSVYVHPFKDITLVFNPFAINEEGYRYLSKQLKASTAPEETSRICASLLRYQGSHNEGEYEKHFTDSNGLYGFQIKKALDYARCHAHYGDLERAMEALAPLMNNVVGAYYPLQEQFFTLALERYGKERVLAEVEKGLAANFASDCRSYCAHRSYEAFGVTIGIYDAYTKSPQDISYYADLARREGYYQMILGK